MRFPGTFQHAKTEKNVTVLTNIITGFTGSHKGLAINFCQKEGKKEEFFNKSIKVILDIKLFSDHFQF